MKKVEKTDNKKEIVTVEETTAAVPTTALTVIPKQEETVEEKNKKLEAEIQQLRAKLSQHPQTLEEKIEFFKQKQLKIKQLAKLEHSSMELLENIEKLEKLIEADDFQCDSYTLTVNEKGYNKEPIFQMNNPIIIRDVIKYVSQRVYDKIDVLKMEIAE